MHRFEENARNLQDNLNAKSLNITESEAAEMICYSEQLMNQISSVLLSTRPQIGQVIRDATTLNSTILEPVQLVAAFFGAIWIYLRMYAYRSHSHYHSVTCRL
jgi:hypothetical protein